MSYLDMPTSSALFSWAWSLKKKEQTSSMMNIFLLIYILFLFSNSIFGAKIQKNIVKVKLIHTKNKDSSEKPDFSSLSVYWSWMKADIGLITTLLFGWTIISLPPSGLEICFGDSFGHIACIVYTGILDNVSPII